MIDFRISLGVPQKIKSIKISGGLTGLEPRSKNGYLELNSSVEHIRKYFTKSTYLPRCKCHDYIFIITQVEAEENCLPHIEPIGKIAILLLDLCVL